MGERDLSGLSESLVNPGESDVVDDSQDTNDQPDATTKTKSTTTSSEQQSSRSGSTPDSDNKLDESDGTEEKRCQETTRDGTQCEHDSLPNSRYCKKHQPDKFGHHRGEFKRKQWTLLPEVADKLFDDNVTADSLYVNVQKALGEEFQKKSIENKMGEFLISREEEFINYVSRKYNEE